MNFFQSVVLVIFGFFAIAAVIIFSMTSSSGGEIGFAGTFKLWGIIPADKIKEPLVTLNSANSKYFKVEYTEKRAETFENDLISALAAGNGPDLVFLPNDLIVQNSDKILPISNDLYPVRNFSDDFADGASLFQSSRGILGMPLYVDPLVMYWNRDIFSTGGIASYPTKWTEFENLARRLTISDRGGNITQATVAMGSFGNIEHVKDILVALFMQTGKDLVRFSQPDERNSVYIVDFGHRDDIGGPASALRFFLDFSDPNKKTYSWNVAMPNSLQNFSGGTLAVYFGLASDYAIIHKGNPHLDFDVAILPQLSTLKNKTTFGNFYGVAVTKGAKNPGVAEQIAIAMSGQDFVKSLSDKISLPPLRRDLLAIGSKDSAQSIFYSSAIMSKSWLDPLPLETDKIFQEMTESVLSGVLNERGSIDSVINKLNNLIKSSPIIE